jgi:hypothetical protein
MKWPSEELFNDTVDHFGQISGVVDGTSYVIKASNRFIQDGIPFWGFYVRYYNASSDNSATALILCKVEANASGLEHLSLADVYIPDEPIAEAYCISNPFSIDTRTVTSTLWLISGLYCSQEILVVRNDKWKTILAADAVESSVLCLQLITRTSSPGVLVDVGVMYRDGSISASGRGTRGLLSWMANHHIDYDNQMNQWDITVNSYLLLQYEPTTGRLRAVSLRND